MSMKPWRVEGCGAFPERSGPVGGCWPETMSMPEVWVCSGQWPSGAVVPPEAQGLKERIMPGFPGEPLAKVTWQSWMIPRENGSVLDALFQVRGSKHGPRKFYPLLLPSPKVLPPTPSFPGSNAGGVNSSNLQVERGAGGVQNKWSPPNFSPAWQVYRFEVLSSWWWEKLQMK